MEELRRFRLMTVRLALAATTVATFAAFPFSTVVAKGILGGGLAGVIAFWIVALRVERLAIRGENRENLPGFRWTVAQLGLYTAVLVWSYALDRERLSGLIGAGGGLFIVRLVQVLLGVTGWDLKQETKRDAGGDASASGRNADGAHR